MKTYNIVKTEDNPNWEKIEKLTMDFSYFDTPKDISANAQLCYTDNEILVHLVSFEKEIRALETGLLGAPCNDSCLEFFFCPIANDNRYFNIEFNSNGCMYLGIASGIGDLVRLIPQKEKYDIFSPKINVFDGGWEIYYSIPFDFIRRFFPDFEINSGKEIRANCSKVCEGSDPQQFLTWSKITNKPFTFHQPQSFGCMKFV